ncbi:MAG TPA: hypothetical protein VLX92_08945 [Kofleriaceae bacterium]|nr:hypothetical protein [Kofleriaceae bacterium]
MTEQLAPSEIGTLAWLEATGGRLDRRARSQLLRGIFPMIRAGFRLRRAAKRSPRYGAPLDPFEPPDTAMVRAAREHLDAHSCRAMAHHAIRTAFWTAVVLDQHGALDDRALETAWVAALLHDVGLEQPAERGDFSAGGVAVLHQLAHDHHWSDDQTRDAGEAIAVNLSTRVDPARVGAIAWAMNVGGTGELGVWPHRAQLRRDRIRELEARYPRDGFRAEALRLIRDEARRLPDGRFALFKTIYWLLMR